MISCAVRPRPQIVLWFTYVAHGRTNVGQVKHSSRVAALMVVAQRIAVGSVDHLHGVLLSSLDGSSLLYWNVRVCFNGR